MSGAARAGGAGPLPADGRADGAGPDRDDAGPHRHRGGDGSGFAVMHPHRAEGGPPVAGPGAQAPGDAGRADRRGRANARDDVPAIGADWADGPLRVVVDDDILRVEVAGWEGPLDLLLDLARRQKVDLRRISVLDLVDQYIGYVARAEALRLELAADYLVTAAWLAYLKSALLLPRDPLEQPPPEEVALRLQMRLARLAAMREAAARLLARDRIGRDVFLRSAPEGLRVAAAVRWECDLFGLLSGYGAVRARTAPVVHTVRSRMVLTLDSALALVGARLAAATGWVDLADCLASLGGDRRLRRSALASGFVAALELARQGRAEIAQDGPFAPLRLRGVAG